jgi:hypothetical protein
MLLASEHSYPMIFDSTYKFPEKYTYSVTKKDPLYFGPAVDELDPESWKKYNLFWSYFFDSCKFGNF